MRNSYKKGFVVVMALIAGAFVITSIGPCAAPTKITGSGTIPSAVYNGGKAHLSFNGDNCGEEVKGQAQYQDKAFGIKQGGGLKLHAEITEAVDCIEFPNGDESLLCELCYSLVGSESALAFEYTSTNPNSPGDGTGVVCLSDGGEGNDAEDFFAIGLLTGPYAGYLNGGLTSGGNIQSHGCDE